ncbi:MAG TPA: hypothetical protein VN372_13065 [Methanospirillum sp.]|nr:hypothetical protein [Methanospirillum sp.]
MTHIEPERIIILVILTVCGILMAGVGNYIMDSHQPVRQESQLLENFLIMQSMAGRNTSDLNLTYMMGSSGLVVSFNDIMTNTGALAYRGPRPVNATDPLQ